MIFPELVNTKIEQLRPAVDELLEHAVKVQTHPGNLLLLVVNGFFSESILTINRVHSENLNPHLIGPDIMGYSEYLHKTFIGSYVNQNFSQLSKKNFLDSISPEQSKFNQEQIAQILDYEEYSMQMEMLIYLKFWEADMTIKRLYEFTRILSGEHYDWYFKLKFADRQEGTGTRPWVLENLVRDKMQVLSTSVHDLLNFTYRRKLRNSIAHSNYTFFGRVIHFNNHNVGQRPNSITFDKWVHIIHNTLALSQEMDRTVATINQYYIEKAKGYDNCFPIMVCEKDRQPYEMLLKYNEEFNRWDWNKQDE